MNILTLAQAARECGLAHSTLRSYADGRRDPTLPATIVGKTYVVTRADFEAWRKVYDALPKRGKRE